jgi:hypothetical protein
VEAMLARSVADAIVDDARASGPHHLHWPTRPAAAARPAALECDRPPGAPQRAVPGPDRLLAGQRVRCCGPPFPFALRPPEVSRRPALSVALRQVLTVMDSPVFVAGVTPGPGIMAGEGGVC